MVVNDLIWDVLDGGLFFGVKVREIFFDEFVRNLGVFSW